MVQKHIFVFSNENTDGNAQMRELLGGKGANLAEMCNLGIAVPPGYTIATNMCNIFYENDQKLPDFIKEQIDKVMDRIESITGKKFGSKENPLLLSVRSGARVSMPGMMDTVLNLGMNDEVVKGIEKASASKRFACDTYRRFIQMYGNVVLGVDGSLFEDIIDEKKLEKGIYEDIELSENDLEDLIISFKELICKQTGENFTSDPKEQLLEAISAVFRSWFNDRAKTYRNLNNIPEKWGTAVNVQAMVFGNLGDDCATGVAFSRNPSTGEKNFYGEYLINAQGEDVVAGVRTPQQITIQGKKENNSDLASMEEVMPKLYKELVDLYQKLELHYTDMQDIEFTIEKNKLWLLQTRNGKRTVQAALKIAIDMVDEGLIDRKEAISRIDPLSLDQLLHPTFDPKAKLQVIAKGLAASPGAASGKIVFSAEEAQLYVNKGEKVILVRIETSPEDIAGMHVSEGILTARGGMTSHAAVVARGMGKSCVCGASELKIDYQNQTVSAQGIVLEKGSVITLNGSTGEVILGKVPMILSEISKDFIRFMEWVDDFRKINVRANAETLADIKIANKFGAEGIGLCRTEHMFFDSERITYIRQMIFAETKEQREKVLSKLLPYQKSDFKEIFTLMKGFPVNIRLLDPPLHEFLPHTKEDIQDLAEKCGISVTIANQRLLELSENNPMLGHRGCRLAITSPEIYDMQVQAIFEAAYDVKKELGIAPKIEIMIPFVFSKQEIILLKQRILTIAKEKEKEFNDSMDFQLGTMIELPRAALIADQIAEEVEYFSFGTNDLTQTTFGISRDDAGSFIGDYINNSILEHDPFVRLDEEGVGALIKLAVEKGRNVNHKLKIGICGEHGGDPKSIAFCMKSGFDYVSCSSYRVPIAKLAVAQEQIAIEKK